MLIKKLCAFLVWFMILSGFPVYADTVETESPICMDDVKIRYEKVPFEVKFRNPDIRLTAGSQFALNGEAAVDLGIAPIFKNNTTLIPLRAFANMINSKVTWVPETQQVILEYGEDKIILTLGSEQAIKNGETEILFAAPFAVNGYTLVPLRFIGETFKLNVDYDGSTDPATICFYREYTPTLEEIGGVSGYNSEFIKYYLDNFNQAVNEQTSIEDVYGIKELEKIFKYAQAEESDDAVNLGFSFAYDENNMINKVVHYSLRKEAFYSFKSDVIDDYYLYLANEVLDDFNKGLTMKNGKEFSWDMNPKDYVPTDEVDAQDSYLIRYHNPTYQFMFPGANYEGLITDADKIAITKAILVVNSLIKEPFDDSIYPTDTDEQMDELSKAYAEYQAGIVRKIHDYLIDNVSYDYKTYEKYKKNILSLSEVPYDGTSHQAYGALMTGKAVCSGYAIAMKIMLDCVGVKSAYISGLAKPYGDDDGHAWNLVNLYGYYYGLDVTWDDTGGGSRYEYFLVSDKKNVCETQGRRGYA